MPQTPPPLLAEGNGNLAEGNKLLAEGNKLLAKGNGSLAKGNGSLAEGNVSLEEGNGSFAKGNKHLAEGNGSLAKGNGSFGDGNKSFAEGNKPRPIIPGRPGEGNFGRFYGPRAVLPRRMRFYGSIWKAAEDTEKTGGQGDRGTGAMAGQLDGICGINSPASIRRGKV